METNLHGSLFTSQLFLIFNHGGIDGPGAFSVAHSICNYLGQLFAGVEPAELRKNIQQRPFADILARIPEQPPMAALPRPKIPENFMPSLKALSAEERDDSSAHISAYWYELDKKRTATLISNCNMNGASIQGTISTAAIIAIRKFPVASKNAHSSSCKHATSC